MNKLGLAIRLDAQIRRIKDFWRVFSRNKLSVLGLVVLFVFASIALSAPIIAPYNPRASTHPVFLPPSLKYIFGTDDIGRDVFSQVLYGFQVSFVIGLLAASIALFIGVIIGGVSGYFGGIVGELLMRITDIFLIIPRLLLAIVLVSFWSTNIWLIILVISITTWPEIARVVRAEFLSLKEQMFTRAAEAVGMSDLRILVTEILPNALSPIVVVTTFKVGAAILFESNLTFLGLGDPETVSWGYILCFGRRFITTAWWIALFPGLMIFIMILALNLVGDGLNEVINPKLRRMERAINE